METNKIQKVLKRNVLLLILIGLCVLFGILSKNFFTITNLLNIVVQNSYLIIASVGVALVMISGGTDLSIGQLMSVVAVCTGAFLNWMELPLPLVLILSILIGAGLGAFNGFAANLLQIHPMIVTLATMTMFQGISFLISGSQAIYNLPASFKFIGQGYVGPIPVPVIIVILVAVGIDFMSKRTYFGRYIFAAGGNPEAARLAGVSVKTIKLLVFVICGALGGLASIVMVSRAGSANSTMGPGTEFNAITACVLGGISFIGGEGEVKGVIIGTLILGVLSNGMQLIGLGIYVQYVVKGIILLLAIGYDTYQKQARVKKVASTKAK